jgi:hypothetical protein
LLATEDIVDVKLEVFLLSLVGILAPGAKKTRMILFEKIVL